MKTKTLLSALVGGIMGLSATCCAQVKQKAPEGRLLYLEYVRRGTLAGSEYKGTLKTDSAGVVVLEAMRQPYGPLYRLTLTEAQVDSFRNLILEEKMYLYEPHYAPPVMVLDGYSWKLDIGFEGKQFFYSGGNNAQPVGGGLQRLCDLFVQLAACPEAEELPSDGPVW